MSILESLKNQRFPNFEGKVKDDFMKSLGISYSSISKSKDEKLNQSRHEGGKTISKELELEKALQREIKTSLGFPAGFKIPEDAIKRRTLDLEEKIVQDSNMNNKKELQYKKKQILTDLEVKPVEELERFDFSKASQESKNDVSKNLIFSLEKELERLKRYKENIQNRIEISKKIPQNSPEYLSKKIVGELKSQGREIIFGTNERIQAKEWSPSHLNDMTLLNIEEVIQIQKEKLLKSEAEYLKTHQGKPFISKIDNYLGLNSKATNASYLDDKTSILASDISTKYQELKAKSLIRGSDYMSYKENLKKKTIKSYNSPIQKRADLNFYNFLLNKEYKNEFETIVESYIDQKGIEAKVKKSPIKKFIKKRKRSKLFFCDNFKIMR